MTYQVFYQDKHGTWILATFEYTCLVLAQVHADRLVELGTAVRARVRPKNETPPLYEVPRPENWVKRYYNVYNDGQLGGAHHHAEVARSVAEGNATTLRIQAIEVETNTGKVRLV